MVDRKSLRELWGVGEGGRGVGAVGGGGGRGQGTHGRCVDIIMHDGMICVGLAC